MFKHLEFYPNIHCKRSKTVFFFTGQTNSGEFWNVSQVIWDIYYLKATNHYWISWALRQCALWQQIDVIDRIQIGGLQRIRHKKCVQYKLMCTLGFPLLLLYVSFDTVCLPFGLCTINSNNNRHIFWASLPVFIRVAHRMLPLNKNQPRIMEIRIEKLIKTHRNRCT